MITANVFRRIFFVRYGNSTATAFTIDENGLQYLITAKHVCPDIKDGDTLQFYRGGSWHDWSVKVVGMGSGVDLGTDIAVLALDHQVSPSFSMPATSANLVWGQEVFFLGYPYGLHTTLDVNNGYPLPLIKRALMSGSTEQHGAPETFLLDGHNNTGFSGGPVVFRPFNQVNGDFCVMGVVSAYITENTSVTFQGKVTELVSPANTGIIICPSIKQVVDMISARPIGARITE
nr:serine protease [Brucella intermedia]